MLAGFLHTVPALTPVFDAAVVDRGVGRLHIADPWLLEEARRVGPTTEMAERIAAHLLSLEVAGAGAVLVTCSSIGEVVDAVADRVAIPVVRVDAPMAAAAVRLATEPGAQGRIVVLATLEATLGPTSRLIRGSLDTSRGRTIVVDAQIVDGAAVAREAGDTAEHDALVRAAVAALEPCDVVVLAQASMAAALEDVGTGTPVLTSPPGGTAALLATLGAAPAE